MNGVARMKDKASLGGAILAAVGASACCWGPVLFAALGLGSFGLGAFFHKWRHVLTAVTFALLAAGFYLVYRKPAFATEKGVAADECGCEVPQIRKNTIRNKIMLWTATGIAAVFLAIPYFI